MAAMSEQEIGHVVAFGQDKTAAQSGHRSFPRKAERLYKNVQAFKRE